MQALPRLSRYFVQVFVVLVALAELGFFLAYFMMYRDQKSMISDILVEDSTYNAVVSALLGFRFVICVLYFVRYYYQGRLEDTSYIQVGFIGVLLAAIGWTWLVTHSDSDNHYLGVGIFCVGSFVYSFVLLRLAHSEDPQYHHIYTIMEILLVVVSGVLVISYITAWALKDPSDYISEHMAYVAHLLFFLLFFAFHTPDPTVPFETAPRYQHNIPEQLDYLLRKQPLHTHTNC
jgi:phosphatidylserine synthase